MAQQQQQRRDEFANKDRNRDRDDDDAGKNNQFGTGGATDPAVTQYTYYETTMATGYGAPPPVPGVPAGAYTMPNYGTYDPTVYGTIGAAGFGTGTGGGQWGQDAPAGGGGGGQWGQDAHAGGGGGGQRGQDAPAGGRGGGGQRGKDANTGDGGGNMGRDQK